MMPNLNENAGPLFDRDYTQGLQKALGRVANDLASALHADGSYIYTLGAESCLIPQVAGGKISESERALFLSRVLCPETDVLAYRMVNRPGALLSDHVQTDRRISPSILNEMQISAALALPVVSDEQLLGLLLLVRHDPQTPFQPADARMAEWFAVAIALALENASLYRQSQSRLAESQALHKVTLALLQKLELEEVLQLVCDGALRLTYAAGSSIALLESDEWLRIMYCTGETLEKLGRVAVAQSHLGVALNRIEPVIINKPPENSAEPVSILAVPLRVQGKTIGVLDVVNKGRGFSADDVRLIHLFADQAAVAVEHASLTRQVHEMAIVEERHRLSRELHDSVNQLLYGISLYTEAAQRKLTQGDIAAGQQHLSKVGESAQEALREMRMLIFELRPSVLGQMGLQAALSQRLKSVEEKLGLQAAFKWRVSTPLEAPVEEALYGIAQEALNNVIRHSQAHNVTVHLVQSGQSLILKIEDDGVGFDPAKVEGGGMGLNTMRERAESLNAQLRVESQVGEGTTVTVEMRD
jgi:signal transduction histidine kinase